MWHVSCFEHSLLRYVALPEIMLFFFYCVLSPPILSFKSLQTMSQYLLSFNELSVLCCFTNWFPSVFPHLFHVVFCCDNCIVVFHSRNSSPVEIGQPSYNPCLQQQRRPQFCTACAWYTRCPPGPPFPKVFGLKDFVLIKGNQGCIWGKYTDTHLNSVRAILIPTYKEMELFLEHELDSCISAISDSPVPKKLKSQFTMQAALRTSYTAPGFIWFISTTVSASGACKWGLFMSFGSAS